MNYWLMKSEPEAFSIDDLQNRKNQTEPWDGVRNYQARNMMRDAMQPGDLAFFYHSNCKQPGIVGIMTINYPAYPDFTAFDPESNYFDPKSSPDQPRWFLVDVKFKQKFKDTLALSLLKQTPALADMLILRKGNRLSITPVAPLEWQTILEMAENL